MRAHTCVVTRVCRHMCVCMPGRVTTRVHRCQCVFCACMSVCENMCTCVHVHVRVCFVPVWPCVHVRKQACLHVVCCHVHVCSHMSVLNPSLRAPAWPRRWVCPHPGGAVGSDRSFGAKHTQQVEGTSTSLSVPVLAPPGHCRCVCPDGRGTAAFAPQRRPPAGPAPPGGSVPSSFMGLPGAAGFWGGPGTAPMPPPPGAREPAEQSRWDGR